MKNITIKSLRDKQNDNDGPAENFFKKPKNEIKELEKRLPKAKRINTISKMILSIIFVLIVGGIGGITIDRFALPYLLFKYPDLKQYEFLERVSDGITYIYETKEVTISPDEAVIEAIKKVSPSVVEIMEFSSDESSSFYKGAGILLTNDGYIITSIDNMTPKENDSDEEERNIIKILLKDEKLFEAKLVKIDLPTGLAIIKIEGNDLPVVALNYSEDINLGETVIIIDNAVITDIVSKFINDYTVQSTTNEPALIQKRVRIINSLKPSFDGSPVLNTKGEIIGISQSGNLFIPAKEIKHFIDSMAKENF
ncbi:MAG: serine protease [Candidatus Pacebacteria bacterium]|nr:serine protease [Candidatus Paceibacterota bacterium]